MRKLNESSKKENIGEDHITRLEDYEKFIGSEAVDRIYEKAEPLEDYHVANINSTYYGGGVAEMLSSLTLLMDCVGLKSGWRIIQGSPDFFSVTKKMHNALQGSEINLSERKKKIYTDTLKKNSIRNHLDHDMVIVHDPQPLAMIENYNKTAPWIWRCHVDLSDPNPKTWDYLKDFINEYNAAIFSIDEYRKDLDVPQLIFSPAIDPFSIKNREFSEDEKRERLEHYDIPDDLPLVVQISRFDKHKDPEGVIKAYKLVRKNEDCTLVLLGNVATDDPEGEKVYQSLLEQGEDRIIILSKQDTALVNALQCKAAVVVQKSIKEGFGLTVTEAMWKRAAVVAGNVGGIKHQIEDGETGFLVDSIEETAEKIELLLKKPDLREKIGDAARKSVRGKYLMSRLLENYIDMIRAFQIRFELSGYPGKVY